MSLRWVEIPGRRASLKFWKTGFRSACSLALGPQNRLWFTDCDDERLFRIELTSGQLSEVPGTWTYVVGLRFDVEGNLWLAAERLGEVWRLDSNGDIRVWAHGLNRPIGVQPDGIGGAYVAEMGSNRVSWIDAARQVTTLVHTAGPPKATIPSGRELLVLEEDSTDSIVSIRLPVPHPDAPRNVAAAAGADSSGIVVWKEPTPEAPTAITSYTVVANPSGNSCTTSGLSCTVTGLTNRQRYTFTVTATNSAGTSEPSAPSNEVMPLAPGFQAWTSNQVTAVGGATILNIAQAAAGSTIAVTGSAKATVVTDSNGFGTASYTTTKAGIQKFTASYSVKVGKKTTKYTTTTQLYVPSVSGPILKIKAGKMGKFSIQFIPSGAAVSIQLSDGRTLTGTADTLGKATFTPTFTAIGAVIYTVSVAGVEVSTGGITVTR